MFAPGWRALVWILLLGLGLRLLLFTGVTGARDDWNEYTNSTRGFQWFGSTEWDGVNRIAIMVPKHLIYRTVRPLEIAHVLHTFLASLACIVVAYLLGRRLFGPKAGSLAAFLMALSPFDLSHATVPFATDIALSATCGLVALSVMYAVRSPGPARFAAVAVAEWLVYRTKAIGILVLLPALGLADNWKTRWRILLAGLSGITLDLVLTYVTLRVVAPEVQGFYSLLRPTLAPCDSAWIWENLRTVFAGAPYGLQPWLGVVGSAVFAWRARIPHAGQRGELFLVSWFLVWLGLLVTRPGGFDPASGELLVFHQPLDRHFHPVLIPAVVLGGRLLEPLQPRWTVALLALLTLHSVAVGYQGYIINRNHREWMESIEPAIDRLPARSFLILDFEAWCWGYLMRPDWDARFEVLQLDAQNRPGNLTRIRDEASARGTVYMLVGGPRGRQTRDDRRFHARDVPEGLHREVLWSRDPTGLYFDKLFKERDPSQLLRLTVR